MIEESEEPSSISEETPEETPKQRTVTFSQFMDNIDNDDIIEEESEKEEVSEDKPKFA